MPISFTFVCQLYCCSSKHTNKAWCITFNSGKTVSTSSMALSTVNKVTSLKWRQRHPMYKQDFSRTCSADIGSGQRLRSSSTSALIVPSTRLSTVGESALLHASWTLCQCVTSTSTLQNFNKRLKPFLFGRCSVPISCSLQLRQHFRPMGVFWLNIAPNPNKYCRLRPTAAKNFASCRSIENKPLASA